MLPDPFVVLATQNPIELEGTYPLPEAQLDRFLMKIKVGYPAEEDYYEILHRTTGGSEPDVDKVVEPETIRKMRRIALSIPVPKQAQTYAIRLVMATQPASIHATEATKRFVALGASPRGVQGLALAGKVQALMEGRCAVSCADMKAVALPVLRHRVLLNFEARAESVESDDVILAALEAVPETSA
jgi:MoxR-like ATPase